MVIIINNKVALAEIQEEKSERARKIGQIIQTSASLMKMTSEKNADDSAPLDYNKRTVELTYRIYSDKRLRGAYFVFLSCNRNEF